MKLARINNILTIVIVVINLFIFCMPLVPEIWFIARQNITDDSTRLEEKVNSNDMPATNRLIVPAILLDEEIHDGPTISTLSQGLWHQPNGVSPGMPGKTIIAGHRFTYDDPEGTFYHLDKLSAGDTIAIYWDHNKYLYSVSDKYVVNPDYKLEPSNYEQLILSTCTPIWNPEDRLIITAERLNAKGEL